MEVKVGESGGDMVVKSAVLECREFLASEGYCPTIADPGGGDSARVREAPMWLLPERAPALEVRGEGIGIGIGILVGSSRGG